MQNKYRVSKKQWAKWKFAGQKVFNDTYEQLIVNQTIFAGKQVMPHADWRIVAWNAAFVAACHAREAADVIHAVVRMNYPKGGMRKRPVL